MNTRDTGSAGVVTVRGEIDLANAAALRQAIADELGGGAAAAARTIVIDLSEVSFIDSSALAVLVAVQQDPAVRLVLVVATAAVERLLSVTGLDQELEIHPTLVAAIAAA